MEKFICKCCGNLSLKEPSGSYEICPICGWEDDKMQNTNPDYRGGANQKSLNESRMFYKKSLC